MTSSTHALTPLSLTLAVGAAAALSAAALAQDSVATSPGGNDALGSADTAAQRVRYVVDLTPHQSSWGNTFRVGPVTKSSRDVNPLFPTQVIAGATLSPVFGTISFPSPADYSVWSTPGPGVNPAENSAPGSVSILDVDRAFGLGMVDLSSTATNAVSLVVGQRSAEPNRLYVERTIGAISRLGADDFSSLSLGGVSSDGDLLLRVDDFNTSGTNPVAGQNIVEVLASARDDSVVNVLLRGAGNTGLDANATSYVVDEAAVTVTAPTVLESVVGSAEAGVLDFAGDFTAGGSPAGLLDPSLAALRGNPKFAAASLGGSDGVVATIAKASLSGPAQSINLAGVDTSGQVVTTSAVTLPSPISTAGFSANASGNAEFNQYFSQVSFRGPSGLVAVGDTSNGVRVAATANDPVQGQFIAVAETDGSAVGWDIAAWEGKPVLDGNGSQIGVVQATAPVTISAPAIDDAGNVYFVGAYKPTTGPAETALYKAHPRVAAAGYDVELLLRSGQSFTGGNTGLTYTLTGLTLGDSDSLASGSFHAGSVLPEGGSDADPSDPAAFGGAVVSVSLEYNRNGVPEGYNTLLFIGPEGDIGAACPGDIDGDGITSGPDLVALLSQFGESGPGLSADLNNSGSVDGADLVALLADFGCN